MTCAAICLTHLLIHPVIRAAAVKRNREQKCAISISTICLFVCVHLDMCVRLQCVCVSEPKCTPTAHLAGPGRFLGHAPAVYREH